MNNKIEDQRLLEAMALRRWQMRHNYCRHPLHINIWSLTIHNILKITHAFYMNDERDLDPFYLEYDR